jgi:hypothetical protein
MAEFPVNEVGGDQIGRLDPPPLRIHHLLLCTVVAAILLTQLHAMRNSGTRWGNSELDWWLITVSRVVMAAESTLAACCIYWRYKGFNVFSEPGSWLPLLSLVSFGGSLLMGGLSARLGNPSFRPKSIWLWNFSDLPMIAMSLMQPIAIWGFAAAIYWFAAVRTADTRPWRLFLLLGAIGFMFHAATNLVGQACQLMQIDTRAYFSGILAYLSPGATIWLLYYGPQVLGTILLAWAMFDDRIKRNRRYWTHWLGCILSLALRLTLIARMLFA